MHYTCSCCWGCFLGLALGTVLLPVLLEEGRSTACVVGLVPREEEEGVADSLEACSGGFDEDLVSLVTGTLPRDLFMYCFRSYLALMKFSTALYAFKKLITVTWRSRDLLVVLWSLKSRRKRCFVYFTSISITLDTYRLNKRISQPWDT